MSKIKIMDELLANKIAAGEVVERSASVVKELVENSIDAEASIIKINLIDAGTKSIKIIDDGTGMDREDAVLAFGRHATSKLKSEEDLYRIETLGFRGEALASIASVSEVVLKTCNKDIGTKVIINGGKIISVENSEANKGTTIEVNNLFFNTPARLKHMKSLYTELASVTDFINKIALSHPEIKFILTNNDTVILETKLDQISVEISNRYSLYGTFVSAPMLYTWMRVANIMWPRTDFRSSLAKAFTEQAAYDPFAIVFFFYGMSILERKSQHQAAEEVRSADESDCKVVQF